MQFAFFATLRLRILNDMAIPECRDAAMSNLNNLHRIVFHDDPDHVIAHYNQQIQSGKMQLSSPPPGDVLDLLRTSTPADINNSPNLEWRYIIRKGIVWKIDPAPDGYTPETKHEADVLALLRPARP